MGIQDNTRSICVVVVCGALYGSIMIRRDIVKLKVSSGRLSTLSDRISDISCESLLHVYHDELDDIATRLYEIGAEINSQIKDHDNNKKNSNNTTVKNIL